MVFRQTGTELPVKKVGWTLTLLAAILYISIMAYIGPTVYKTVRLLHAFGVI